MFNKLVVSTSERRSRRTSRFFLGTFVIYLLVIASAMALSVVFANPRMADSTARTVMITPLPPPAYAPPKPVISHSPALAPSRADLRNVERLESILSHQGDSSPRPNAFAGPPKTGDVIEGGINGDPNGVQYGIPQAALVPETASADAAPKPPEPPKPAQPRTQEDNRPVRLNSTVLQGKALSRHTPDYPPLARQARLQGSVSVEVMIAPDGRVESARAVSGHPMFARAAEDSALRWRFQPTLLNGTPVRVTGIIVFNFKLGE